MGGDSPSLYSPPSEAEERRTLKEEGYELPLRDVFIWAFGGTPRLANELGGLVRQGTKTATCSSLASYEQEERLPQVGDISALHTR